MRHKNEAKLYFKGVAESLKRIPDDGLRCAHINRQIEIWERHERRLAEWAKNPSCPHPFSPPLDAFLVAFVITELTRILGQLEDKIRQRIADAEAVIGPDPYRHAAE